MYIHTYMYIYMYCACGHDIESLESNLRFCRQDVKTRLIHYDRDKFIMTLHLKDVNGNKL